MISEEILFTALLTVSYKVITVPQFYQDLMVQLVSCKKSLMQAAWDGKGWMAELLEMERENPSHEFSVQNPDWAE